MSEENLRQKQARERRAQLLEQALELFSVQGVEATSVKDLAVAAGVTPGLLYHYFDSKEALVAAVFAEYSFAPQIREIVGKSEGVAVRVVLETVGRRFCQMLQERSSLVRVLMREALVNPVVAAQLSAVIGSGIHALTDFLQARIATGELRSHNVAVTARALMFPLLLRHVLFGDTSETFASDLVDTLIQGIAAPQ